MVDILNLIKQTIAVKNQNYQVVKPASLPQVQAVIIYLRNFTEDDREKRLWLLEQLFGRPFVTTKDLTMTEASVLLDTTFSEGMTSGLLEDAIEELLENYR